MAVGPVPSRRRVVLMTRVWRMPEGPRKGSPHAHADTHAVAHGGNQVRVRHGRHGADQDAPPDGPVLTDQPQPTRRLYSRFLHGTPAWAPRCHRPASPLPRLG